MRPLPLLLVLAPVLVAPVLAAPSEPASFGPPPAASTYLSVEEALSLAFPDCDVERRMAVLTQAQAERAEELLEGELPTRVVYPYFARRDGELVGTAYFDNHKVRTLKETVMVVVDPEQCVQRIEVLAFAEPEDYLPRSSWYAQFVGRALDDELWLKRGIRSVTGATLTARATTDCVRRVLAVHQVLAEVQEPPDGAGRKDAGGRATAPPASEPAAGDARSR